MAKSNKVFRSDFIFDGFSLYLRERFRFLLRLDLVTMGYGWFCPRCSGRRRTGGWVREEGGVISAEGQALSGRSG